jgi:hypothetical protein
VHWLGMLSDDEVAARLAGADVLCAPSLHGESFGMVLLSQSGRRPRHARTTRRHNGPLAGSRRRPRRRRRRERTVFARGAQGWNRTRAQLVDGVLGGALRRGVRARDRVVSRPAVLSRDHLRFVDGRRAGQQQVGPLG